MARVVGNILECGIPDDQVKLGVEYLVESLIFAKQPKTLVNPKILAIVRGCVQQGLLGKVELRFLGLKA